MAKRKPNQLESDAPDSSMNALKHGLYARKWLNPEERDLYEELLAQYSTYYEPEGAPEYALVETIVACRVKLLRFHAIEEAQYDLAQSKATDPQHYLDSVRLDHDGMEKDFAAALYGSYRPPEEGLDPEFAKELNQTPVHEISGWGYVENHMPLLREHLVNAATTEKLSLTEFIDNKVPQGGIRPIRIIFRPAGSAANEDDVEEQLELKCDQVDRESLQRYVERLSFLAGKQYLLLQLVVDYHSRMSTRLQAAMPTPAELANVHRARTAEQKLMSQSTGELIELQRLRQLKSRRVQPV